MSLTRCAYCGKTIRTENAFSRWGKTEYYCNENCCRHHEDKVHKQKKEAYFQSIGSSTSKRSTGVAYSPAQFTGYKEQKFTDGSRYVGDFLDGKRHGKGTNYFPDGTSGKTLVA